MFTEDLKTCKEKVNMILRIYPKTRDSDKLLWLQYMETFHKIDIDIELGDYENFKKTIMSKETVSFESLRRTRQKQQEIDEMLRGERYHERKHEATEVAKYMKEF